MKTAKKKWRADWLAYFDGWRTCSVLRPGQRYLMDDAKPLSIPARTRFVWIVECSTGKVHRMTAARWAGYLKAPIVRNKIQWDRKSGQAGLD